MPKKVVHEGQLTWDVESVPWYHDFLLFLYAATSIGYLVWLEFFTLDWSAWFAIPLIFAELYRIFFSTVALICARTISYPRYTPPLKNVTVDALIPTYNEPIEIVRQTAEHALKIEGINKVYILDDGNRPFIKSLAKEIGAEYAARTTNEHAKAGNMNNGLKHSTADFIIMLDADHVPQSNFITRTLGYFIDQKIAIIQTPQVFYNTKSIQHRENKFYKAWNEQTMFYESIQPAKNVFNSAFFCGTSAILRRKALDSVGGFATGTATEDIHTSIRIHNKGWKTIFINEKLAYGLAPEDLKEYHKQRVRWGAGSLGLLFRSPDSPLRLKNLTFMQRMNYFNSTMAYAQGICKLFFYILPISIIFSPATAFKTPFFVYIAIYIPYLSFSLWMTKVYSRNTYHPWYTEQFNIINILSNFESLKGIWKVQKKFSVSIKLKNKRESTYVFPLLVVIALGMMGMELYGFYQWYALSQGNFLNLPPDSLLMSLFWNGVNVGMISSTLLYLYKYQRSQQKNALIEVTTEKSKNAYRDFLTNVSDGPSYAL